MSVHYKFKSALEYDTVTFDGLHISVKDLKNAIIQQKRIGKNTDFDLQVTNAQTKEVYEDENTLIPKNTSLLIARIPILVQKTKTWEGYGGDSTPPPKTDEAGPIAKAVDLSSLDAPEDDKIKAMMSQSTQEYDPSNYVKIRGANQVGAVPPNYRCYKCHQGGHWIKDCTFGQGPEPMEIKKSTGIPRNFLVPVEGPQVPGAMMTPNGQYAVPMLDLQAYSQKATPAPVPAPKVEIPEDLICSICQDLLADAVMIPCCGNSFCDECIRSVLLESEDHECPDCHEKDISPDTLIPNRFLRTSVANFKNTTGYVKKPTYRERIEPVRSQPTSTKVTTPPPEPESTEKIILDEKTVISEADSTENSKNCEEKDLDLLKDDDTKDESKSKEAGSTPEGPPGVSPKTSPGRSPKDRDRPVRRVHSSRDSKERARRNSRNSRQRDDSPRKTSRHLRSPSYNSPILREERSSTPTVDEPNNGVGYGPYGSTGSVVPTGPVPGNVPTLIGAVPPIQGPPPPGMPTTFPPGQPPIGSFPSNQGPMPNYRLPPPGSAPFLGPGPFPVPPRAMFDGSRPPIGGFPPNFNPNIPPVSRTHRDFNRRVRDRTPPGLIDDPLAAFNRMLREKDERKRRAKRRSYSRSRSRSRSYSRSPVRRRGSRSPRPSRRSRSRSRSFSLSRSRSRSYTGSPWGSPYNNRQASPPARRSPLVTRRGAPTSRYRSPPPLRPSRSPPSRSRHPTDRHRDRDFEDDRDFGDRDRSYKDRNRERGRNSRDRRPSSRERDRYYDNYDERSGGTRGDAWQQNRASAIQDGYYPPPADIQQGYQNRFGQGPPREYVPPYMNKEAPLYGQPVPPQRQFQDIKPPGVDDDIAPPGVDEPPPQPLQKLSPKHDETEKGKDKEKERRRSRDRRDRSTDRDRKRRHDRKSRTPDKARNSSPRRKSKSKDRDSPEKHKRRRRDSSDREERKRDSDDERSKKSRDKKKHKDRKESDKKKKRDRKDKHKKESKEKKSKEEFKQVIPKSRDDDSDEDNDRKERKKESHEKTSREDSKRHSEEKPSKEKERKEPEETSTMAEEEVQTKKNKIEMKVKKSREINVKQAVKEIKKEIRIEDKENEDITSTTPARVEYGDLYGDLLNEEIDTKVIQNYGKIEEEYVKKCEDEKTTIEDEEEEGEIKEFEDEESEEKDVLELHLNDIDLKTELDKSDILAPVPEISKWEVDEDILTSPKDGHKLDSKTDKSGKVTNEVLKRAENAIFAKAIKAIRPLDIKKREVEKSNNKIQVTVSSAIDITSPPVPQRLSVKERLGVKVDDPDKVINLSRNRSRSVSPFSRRGEGGRNFDANDRRVELESARSRRSGRNRSRSRGRGHSRDRRVRIESRTQIRDNRRRSTHGRDKNKKEERSRHDDDRKSTRKKRTRSRSESEEKKEKHKKKDKKQKKDKSKKSKDDEDVKTDKEAKDEGKQLLVTKRKPTIDEATFEPDYDLESHSDEEEDTSTKKKASKKQSEEEEEKSSSSESDSDSSSEEDRKRKKHKKHKKRKKKESSSSSSSESESESSDSDRGKKKKKHRKNKKKKKKSKHK